MSGTNSEGAFSIHNHVADNVLLENGGHLGKVRISRSFLPKLTR
ncbi:putative ATP-binding component of a transport system domain protein [Escherichia coli 1-182-04_S3_C2]|nr:putative ATP-binding component of a transport system domain protein [Escherichia coli 1-182-04_S3_C2]EZJ84657.1 putative ATP-binding component of a transport system domain protein [Escherichia coli 1-182-04_S3_C3]